MPARINIPPSPRQDDTEAMSTWYARIRGAILKTGQAITWLNLDFTGSNLTSILTRNHNDLQNVQGGSNGSRYHLTSAEHTDLTDGGGTTLHTHSYNNLTDLPTAIYGGFSDTTDQTLAAANTGYAISFDTHPVMDGITLVTGTKVTVPTTGIYSISFSAQITSTSASTKMVWFWPKLNGTSIPGSTIIQTISGASTTLIVTRNGLFSLNANDYIEAWWAADSTAVQLEAAPATAFAPTTPSAVLAIHKVA